MLGVRQILLAVVIGVFVVMAAPAEGDTAEAIEADSVLVAQDESPYQVPPVEVEGPSWLEPLGPIASWPLWAVATLVAAVAATAFFVIPTGVRWAWRTMTGGFGKESEE